MAGESRRLSVFQTNPFCFSIYIGIVVFIFMLAVRTSDGQSGNFTRFIPDCVNTEKYSCLILHHDYKKDGHEPDDFNLHVYCYIGATKKWWKLWSKPQIKVTFPPDASYKVYWGRNASDVHQQYETDYMARLTMIYRPETLSLEPFNRSCVGISSENTYHLHFTVKSIELWYTFFQVLGIFLFFSAKKLSKNSAFHYSTGVSVGVLASVVIVAYIMGKYIPRKAGFVAFFLGGWSLMSYAIYYVYYQFRSIMEDHYQYVLAYLITVGLVSFGVCYKYGPVSDPRSLNLIQWTIQLAGLASVYFACQLPEISAAVIVIMFCVYNFPKSVLDLARQFRYKFFPPKRRNLTEEEYIREGDEETRKALEELREFCRSPNCNTWKTVSRLQSPTRFASFVEGDSHINDDELMDYDSDPEPRVSPRDGDSDSDGDHGDHGDGPVYSNHNHRWQPPRTHLDHS